MKLNIEAFAREGHYQPIVTDSEFWATYDPRFLTHAPRESVDRLVAIEADMKRRVSKSGLDIGCNIGFFCHALEARGYKMTGIDSDEHSRAHTMPSVIGTAQRLSAVYGIEPTFVHGSYLNFVPAACPPVDAILCLSIFHHLFRWAKANGYDEEAIRGTLRNLFDKADHTLYLEMSTVFPEVAAMGWTKDKLPAIIKDVTGAEPEAIHVSPDAHLEPRIVYAIRK